MSFACRHLTFSLLPASMSADARTQLLTGHLVSAKTKSSDALHRTSSSHQLLRIVIIIIDISSSSSSSLLSKAMEDIASHGQHGHPAPHCREKFNAAMLVAAGKVEKTDKGEMPTEMFVRINAAQVVKENKSIKSAAKKLVKKRKLKKISTFFFKKPQFELAELLCFSCIHLVSTAAVISCHISCLQKPLSVSLRQVPSLAVTSPVVSHLVPAASCAHPQNNVRCTDVVNVFFHHMPKRTSQQWPKCLPRFDGATAMPPPSTISHNFLPSHLASMTLWAQNPRFHALMSLCFCWRGCSSAVVAFSLRCGCCFLSL
jgi:hypothetical protein